ncbi:MAG: hypothetical protein H0U64_05175 [Gemmatimonadaceae bacterium]|nr:hypothetical protein [Gemmatimonadaceae bacterium]
MSAADTQQYKDEKLAEMRAAVAARLKHVCHGMDDSAFDTLVTQIAAFKIKWGESLIYDNPPALGAWMFAREKGDNKKQ